MNNKSVIASTIGYMCIGFTVWMLGLGLTTWVAGPNDHAHIMMFTLGTVVLGVIAILTFFHGRTLDAIIFFGAAGVLFSGAHHGMGQMGMAGDSSGTMGWYFLLWAVFFFYVWLGSFKTGWARSLFLLATWLALLAICLLHWLGWEGFSYIGGYLALLSGLVATYISAAEVLNHGCGKVVLQTGSKDS